ncbi:hypothetical protein EJB05_15068, partial [Eragrostis curvula]
MVDQLLQLADDPNLEVPIGRDGVKAFTLVRSSCCLSHSTCFFFYLKLCLWLTKHTLLPAGSHRRRHGHVEWAMSELLRNPDVLAKATAELDSVVGRGRLVTEADVPSLPYLDAVVKEVMRLHPAAPLLVPRLSREATTTVDGYDIPAGTRVFVNVWAIGRDPATWAASAEFRPERFFGSVA